MSCYIFSLELALVLLEVLLEYLSTRGQVGLSTRKLCTVYSMQTYRHTLTVYCALADGLKD